MPTLAEKDRARRKVRNAVLRGRLKRPAACEDCGSTPPLNRNGFSVIQGHHHHGYDFPLDVRWLCPSCHFKYDQRPAGKANGRAKLSPIDVAEIRRRYVRGNICGRSPNSAAVLAREFGVSIRNIKMIVTNQIWKSDSILSEAENGQ